MACNQIECVAVASINIPKPGIAEPHRVLQHGVVNRLQFTRRRADYAKHICRGGLLLQRFAQFVEQPRVLDSDDGLGGKIFNELDLFLGEGADFLASSLSIGTVT